MKRAFISAVVSSLLLAVMVMAQPASETPLADKAIKEAADAIKKARETATNAKEKDKLGKALASLEQLLDAKATQYTRDTLKQAIIGKTQDDVIKLLGRPLKTYDGTTGASFFYELRVLDTISGAYDRFATVQFNKAKTATRIGFSQN